MHTLRKHRGFTLLEVLIAVLIFSIGLLGSAGLMVLSVRTNHSAFLRTQATFLADSMIERIRANAGVTNSYNGTYGSATAGTESCAASACNQAQLVARDQALWSQQLVDSLPGGEAEIECTGASSDTTGDPIKRQLAAYNGTCTLTITWIEADLERGSAAAAPATQTFAWVFQP